MSIAKHIKEHLSLGIPWRRGSVVETTTPDWYAFFPLNEGLGDTTMDVKNGIVQRLSTAGTAAWVTGIDGYLGPGGGTGEHINTEALLSGELPVMADTQGLVIIAVWQYMGGASGGIPAFSYGQSGNNQSGVTFSATTNYIDLRMNDGDATTMTPVPATLDASIWPDSLANHCAALFLDPVASDGTRAGRMYCNGSLVDTVSIPASKASLTSVENTLNMSGVNSTNELYCVYFGLYSTMPTNAAEYDCALWMRNFCANQSATSEKAIYGRLIGDQSNSNGYQKYPNELIARDSFGAGAGAISTNTEIEYHKRLQRWVAGGDPINYNGTGAATPPGTGATGFNGLITHTGAQAKTIKAIISQEDVGVAGGISIILRSDVGFSAGIFRVLASHDGAGTFSLAIQSLNGGFTWDTHDTDATQTVDFNTESAVLTITDDLSTITAWLNNDTAKAVSYASTANNTEEYVGLYTEDGDGTETDCYWHDFIVLDGV